MAQDIFITFSHLTSGKSISGYITAEPMDVTDDGQTVTPELARAMTDEAQQGFANGRLMSITLHTRDELNSQITVTKRTLDDCVMVSYIKDVQS